MSKKNSLITSTSLILVGLLLFMYNLFLFYPNNSFTDGINILAWINSWKINIMISNEISFFTIILLLVSLLGLCKFLIKNNLFFLILGCSLTIITSIVFIFSTIIQGRLIYPISDLILSSESLILLTSIYYGTMHTFYLLLSLIILFFGMAMSKSLFEKKYFYLSIFVSIICIITSFSWIISPLILFVFQIMISFWFIYVGYNIYFRFVKNK